MVVVVVDVVFSVLKVNKLNLVVASVVGAAVVVDVVVVDSSLWSWRWN